MITSHPLKSIDMFAKMIREPEGSHVYLIEREVPDPSQIAEFIEALMVGNAATSIPARE